MIRSFLLFVLLAGCATTSGSGSVVRESLRFEAGPAQAGWKRLQTADFELLTDLDDAEARRAAQLLTQSLEGLRALFGKAPVQRPRTLRVVAMRDDLEFERRFGKYLWGFVAHRQDDSLVCLYGPPDRWFVRPTALTEVTHSVLQHELAHAVLATYFPVQPKWFAEGMAQYLETFRWLDAEQVVVGEPNLKAWQGYAAVRSLSMADLLSWTASRNDREEEGFYGLSWAFIHWAASREPQRFGELLAAVVNDDAEPVARTFGSELGAIDRAIHAHLKDGQYAKVTLRVPLGAPRSVRLETIPAPLSLLDALTEQMDGGRHRWK